MRWRSMIALCVIGVGAILVWLLFPRTGYRDRVLELAREEERSRDPRRTHVSPPLPGTFGDLLQPHLAGLHESSQSFQALGEDAKQRVVDLYSGRESISKLGWEAFQDLALHRSAVRGALRATHAESARPPASMTVFALWRPGDPFADMTQAARLAAIEMFILVDQGRSDEAAQECADTLALGRDVSYPSVLGRMIGVAITGIAAPACARALSTARPGTVERVRAQLVAIRAGTPRFEHILQRENLFVQLLHADADERMPESARVLIEDSRASRTALSERVLHLLFRETARDRLQARMVEYLQAQRLGWPACVERMESVARNPFEWNLLVRADVGFPNLLRRHRNGLLKLDALICAASTSLARSRRHGVRTRAMSRCPPIEPDAKCGERGAGARIVDDSSGARVSVTLSDGSDYTLPMASPTSPTTSPSTAAR